MYHRTFVFCLTGALVCAAMTACGGSSTPANSPDSVDEAALAESSESSTKPTAGHGVEVGVEFEDKGDTGEKRDRTPPPTPTYKPSNKGKQAAATP